MPLTVVSVAVAGGKWTRKYYASTTESLVVLILLQLIPVVFAQALGYGEVEFLLVNLLFAPWWLLGHVVAVATGPQADPSRGARC